MAMPVSAPRQSGPAAGVRRPALATATVFALSGFLFAAWVSRLPATRDRIDAGPAELGLALLATGAGSLLVMPMTGRLCARYGSRRVVAATALPCCVVLVALAFLPGLLSVGVGLLLLGAGYGAWDVSMNVHASFVDRVAGRDLMPRYHACWSAGAISGAGSGALAARAGLPVSAHFGLVAVGVAATLLTALRRFLDDATRRPAEDPLRAGAAAPFDAGPGDGHSQPTPRHRTQPRLAGSGLVAIGLVTLCATCIEGAAADWLALYLTDGRGVSQAVAATGYAVFSVAMAATRFSGTWLIAWIGRPAAVRLGGLVTGTGVVVTVAAPWLWGSLVGALLWGLGVAVVFPAAMSAGGELPGRAADGIAAVSTIGYGGFLLGPPLIGFVAEQAGLGRALLMLVVLAGGIVWLAPAVRPVATTPAPRLG